MSFKNPSPPPGHIETSEVEISRSPNFFNGVHYICRDLLLESGIFDATESYDEFIIMSSDDELQAPVIIKQEPFIKQEPLSPKAEEILSELSDDLRSVVKIEKRSPSPKEKKSAKNKERRSKRRERSISNSSSDSELSRKIKHKESKHKSKSKSNSRSSDDRHEYREVRIKTEDGGSDYIKAENIKIEIKQEVKKENIKNEKIKTEHIKTERIKTERIKTENIKTEKYDDLPNMLHGAYYCDLCKASMNSYGTYLTHINGKRHLKNIKLKNTAEVVAKSIAPTKVESRYPPPPKGVYRMKTNTVSVIQHIVDTLKDPCPGLDKVTEIQGLEETTYYCELCDAPCTAITIVPHLQGHKHQLRSVKLFEPEIYEEFRYKKKHEIERKVINILKDAERKHGRGYITVEVECEGTPPVADSKYIITRKDVPGPSYMDPDDEFPDNYELTTIPDTSKSDFYCKLCDSHMNSEQMWEAHIRGKRHLTNVKKAPGEPPSKTKSVLVPNARPKIVKELDRVHEPVVGLDEMRETQNPDAPGEMYNCFLCGACMTSLDVIDHILSQKHRTKYLEKIKHEEYLLLKQISIQENKSSSIIEEICAKVEQERGRGKMEVHVVRNAIGKW